MRKEHQPQDKSQLALESIRAGAKTLSANRRKLQEYVDPQTTSGKVIKAAQRLPLIGDKLNLDIPRELRASLRQSIIDMYKNMKELLREGTERLEHHNQLQSLLKDAANDPANYDLVQEIHSLLRARVEEELGLDRDPETDELISKIYSLRDPKTVRENIIAEAKQRLEFSQPIIQATQTVLVSSVEVFDRTQAVYAQVLELGPLAEQIMDTTSDIQKAASLNITGFRSVLGQIDTAVLAAQQAVIASQIGAQLDRTTNIESLKALNAKTLKLLPQTNQPQLPQASEQ